MSSSFDPPIFCRAVAACRRRGSLAHAAPARRGRAAGLAGRVGVAALVTLLALGDLACLGVAGQAQLAVSADPEGLPPAIQSDTNAQLPGLNLTLPDPNPPVDPPPAPQSKVAIIGRAVSLDPGAPLPLHQGQPNVAMGVRFRGSGLKLTMSNPKANTRAFFNLMVDGVSQPKFAVTHSSPTVYTLAKGLDPSTPHTIWWTRRNEPLYTGQADLHLVDPGVDGELLDPPAVPSRRIEVFGASVELGWCCSNPSQPHFSDDAQDATLGWPQIAADLVDAALINTAMAGAGLHWTINGDSANAMASPKVWTRVDLSDPSLTWDPNTYPMSVVFINLIGNDWEGVGGKGLATPSLAAAWQATAIAFTDALYKAYPGVSIYFILSAVYTGSERSVSQMLMADTVTKIQQAHPANIGLIEMPYAPNASSGCDGHPLPAAHQAMGAQAAARLKQDLNW